MLDCVDPLFRKVTAETEDMNKKKSYRRTCRQEQKEELS